MSYELQIHPTGSPDDVWTSLPQAVHVAGDGLRMSNRARKLVEFFRRRPAFGHDAARVVTDDGRLMSRHDVKANPNWTSILARKRAAA